MTAPQSRTTPTWPSLIALAVGLLSGAALHVSHPVLALNIGTVLEPVGTLWTSALRMIVVPLVLTNLMLALASGANTRGVGRMTGISMALFVALLTLATGFTLVLAPILLQWFTLAPFSVDTLVRSNIPPTPAVTAEFFNLGKWLVALVPTNPFRAATSDDILPVLVFTAAMALSLRQLAQEVREPFLAIVRAISEAMFVLLHAILKVMPLGILALTFNLAARTGSDGIGAVGFFVVFVTTLLLGCTLALYPVAVIAGGMNLGRFAWGVLPSQVVAAGTRSSIASLPSMLEGAEQRLALPREVTHLVLPLAVSTFKLNRAVSSTAQLLFLARLYDVHLEPSQIATFVATIGLMSFGTPGIPSTGTHASLPAYLAVGIPVEGVMILGAVAALPDIFKTILNVTANMTVAVLVGRFGQHRETPTS